MIGRSPERGRRCGRDRDAAFPLLLHPVHHRVARVHFADFVRNASIKKYAFGNGRFAGINVCDDADISNFLSGSFGA